MSVFNYIFSGKEKEGTPIGEFAFPSETAVPKYIKFVTIKNDGLSITRQMDILSRFYIFLQNLKLSDSIKNNYELTGTRYYDLINSLFDYVNLSYKSIRKCAFYGDEEVNNINFKKNINELVDTFNKSNESLPFKIYIFKQEGITNIGEKLLYSYLSFIYNTTNSIINNSKNIHRIIGSSEDSKINNVNFKCLDFTAFYKLNKTREEAYKNILEINYFIDTLITKYASKINPQNCGTLSEQIHKIKKLTKIMYEFNEKNPPVPLGTENIITGEKEKYEIMIPTLICQKYFGVPDFNSLLKMDKKKPEKKVNILELINALEQTIKFIILSSIPKQEKDTFYEWIDKSRTKFRNIFLKNLFPKDELKYSTLGDVYKNSSLNKAKIKIANPISKFSECEKEINTYLDSLKRKMSYYKLSINSNEVKIILKSSFKIPFPEIDTTNVRTRRVQFAEPSAPELSDDDFEPSAPYMEEDDLIVFDEFTSVVDRNVAKIGSYAMQKAIRKSDKQFIAVTCHHDVQDWLLPD